MKPKLIYLDDSRNNLIGFEGQFSDTFDIQTFLDPKSALDVIEKLDPCIILCDQKMPSMAGYEFLGKTIPLVPNAIRILFTGYSEEDLVINSIRIGKVHDYIRKPCTEEELKNRLDIAFGIYKENMKKVEEYRKLKQDYAELQKLHKT